MATVCTTRVTVPSRIATPPPHHPPHSQLSINTSTRGAPAAVPNKHLAKFPTIQKPLDHPPASPPTPSQLIETTSLTYPPSDYERLTHDPPLYSITGAKLARALEHIESQPLPTTKQVFPWLHGLHAENAIQLAFFTARRKSARRTPKCIRGLTIVKVGDPLHSKLKGAITPEEILKPWEKAKNGGGRRDSREGHEDGAEFLEIDPRDGFNVRNFQIQACKMATVSDVVVYGDEQSTREEVQEVARRISRAQGAWQKKTETSSCNRLFNTFVLADDYANVAQEHPDLIALDADGCMTGKVMDFFHWERLEMCSMSAPTEISRNVWLGPTPDPTLSHPDGEMLFNDADYDIQVEASDLAQIPDTRTFKMLEVFLERRENGSLPENEIPLLEFPGSGAILPPTWSQAEVDGLLTTCEWLHQQALGVPMAQRKRRDSKLSPSPERDIDGDSVMHDEPQAAGGRRILIHCTDGYTESSLLALAYYMYAECVPAHEAWLQLHRTKGRNFFAYASDVALLRAIQPRILQASPKFGGDYKQLCPPVPEWLDKMDGSLPSRILPYMYLGNLGHANNPELLRELGIGQILSVGEPVNWTQATADEWGLDNLLYVDKVQDNGVDPLTEDFGRCLEFIENGRKNNTATLVHCRVGVSRSATICIAEVMNELGLSFPRAYCFVRARRLNVIIQPHLRFSYELLKWEEFQCQRRGKPMRRELEWATIAREIAAMNKPYSRQN